ncbi:TPR-like protein [Polychaeton citri CBS 116435]|uniref:Peroxisomal targeting signal receptor n=1 Tax=Polychaeton citri CBS 116435 TaxID=1314669 RepID=A0A9P4Q3Q7_9PEZI|nr:TPR-like protein [Polychaeton citri CBS 116435]
MSFLGGPECSTAANPLAQFQKQTSQDTSLQRDRLQNLHPAQLNSFRSQQQGGVLQDAAFNDFAQQSAGQLPFEQIPAGPGPMGFEPLHRHPSAQSAGSSAWAGEFAQHTPAPGFAPEDFSAMQRRAAGNSGFSAQEFASFQKQQQQQPRTQSPAFASQAQGLYGVGQGSYGGFGIQRPMGMYSGGYMSPSMGMQHQHQPQMQGKGKGKIQELSDTDWEQQFAELSTQDKEDEELDRQAQRDIDQELEGIDRSMMASDEETLAHHFGDEYDQWKDFDGIGHDFDGLRTYNDLRPELGHYTFEANNIFKDVPNPFEEGVKIMRAGGSLSLASLAFERAVQKQPNHVDAWVMLGQAQAQNEKETPAIRALEQAISIDPNNLDALMSLSVSYTNEGYDSLAYRTLERWISAKYPQLGVSPRGLKDSSNGEEEIGFTDRQQLHQMVTDLFLQAARINPEGTEVDVDVQVGLGVLFYGSEDYDQAVDCFTAALNSHHHGSLKQEGEEHLLWNRLGATLANSGRSEEAIEAYTHALELQPNFVRARYNLGVSCINLGVQDQAAAHLLGALSMHRVIELEGREKARELMKDGQGNDLPAADAQVDALLHQNESTNLYDTLRRVFTQMGRRDLAEIVGPDMDLERLKGEFDF